MGLLNHANGLNVNVNGGKGNIGGFLNSPPPPAPLLGGYGGLHLGANIGSKPPGGNYSV